MFDTLGLTAREREVVVTLIRGNQDVTNLRKIADAFPKERFDVFIVFSKLGHFTCEEIESCRAAQDKYQYRVILLSERELEPYFVYERAALKFDIDKAAIALEDLAKNTHHIYFDPKPKDKDASGGT